jgi:hypothetical protein
MAATTGGTTMDDTTLSSLGIAQQQRIRATAMTDVARESRRAASMMAESAARMIENAHVALIEARLHVAVSTVPPARNHGFAR